MRKAFFLLGAYMLASTLIFVLANFTMRGNDAFFTAFLVGGPGATIVCGFLVRLPERNKQ